MKFLFTIILSATFFTCHKDTPDPVPQPGSSGSIQYKVNGNPVVINNVSVDSAQYAMFHKQLNGSINKTKYVFKAQKGVNNLFYFSIVTDSLVTTNYRYDSITLAGTENVAAFGARSNGQNSIIFYKNDFFDINISSYQGGRATGTFTGRFTPYDGSTPGAPSTIEITDGMLDDVPITY